MKETITIRNIPYTITTLEDDETFESIVALNAAVHGDGVGALARVLRQSLPGMGREDWYAIVDPRDGSCLSTLCRIPGSWTYAGAGVSVDLPVEEMGLVATAERARGLGLSSALIKRYMADSRSRGFLVSVIQGIPYFYRRFGYEYSLPLLMGARLGPGLSPWRDGKAAGQAQNQLRRRATRPASEADLAFLMCAHAKSAHALGVRADRDEKRWRFLLGPALRSPETAIDRRIILGDGGEPLGYFGVQRDCFGPTLALVESSLPDESAGLSAMDFLAAAEELREEWNLPHATVLVDRGHPVSIAAQGLGSELFAGYGWQAAVLDALAFCKALAPVLEARLAASSYAGKPYALSISLYGDDSLSFAWDGSRLAVSMGGAGATRLPPELLAPLALGFRSLSELRHCRLDISAGRNDEAFICALFPKMDGFAYPAY